MLSVSHGRQLYFHSSKSVYWSTHSLYYVVLSGCVGTQNTWFQIIETLFGHNKRQKPKIILYKNTSVKGFLKHKSLGGASWWRHFVHRTQDMTFFVCKLITLSFEMRVILLRPRLLLYNSLFSFIYGYQQNYDTVTNILIYRLVTKKRTIGIYFTIVRSPTLFIILNSNTCIKRKRFYLSCILFQQKIAELFFFSNIANYNIDETDGLAISRFIRDRTSVKWDKKTKVVRSLPRFC